MGTWLGISVIHSVAIQLEEFLGLCFLLSIAAHGESVLADLQEERADRETVPPPLPMSQKTVHVQLQPWSSAVSVTLDVASNGGHEGKMGLCVECT